MFELTDKFVQRVRKQRAFTCDFDEIGAVFLIFILYKKHLQNYSAHSRKVCPIRLHGADVRATGSALSRHAHHGRVRADLSSGQEGMDGILRLSRRWLTLASQFYKYSQHRIQ